MQRLVARRKAVAKGMQNPKIDLVGAVRVGRVPRWLDVGGVVVEQVEHKMALVFMGTDDLCIDWYVVGHYGAGAHPLVPAKILRRIPGVEGIDLGFKPLAIAAGMQLFTDVE